MRQLRTSIRGWKELYLETRETNNTTHKAGSSLFDHASDFVAAGMFEDLLLELMVHGQLRVLQESLRRRDVHKLHRSLLQVTASVGEDPHQDSGCCLWRAAKSVDNFLGNTFVVVFAFVVCMSSTLYLRV